MCKDNVFGVFLSICRLHQQLNGNNSNSNSKAPGSNESSPFDNHGDGRDRRVNVNYGASNFLGNVGSIKCYNNIFKYETVFMDKNRWRCQ